MEEGEEKKGEKMGHEMSPVPSRHMLTPELSDVLVQAALPKCLLAPVSAKTLMVFPSLAVTVGKGKRCAELTDWWLWGQRISAEEGAGGTWLVQTGQSGSIVPWWAHGCSSRQEVVPAETPARGLGSSTEGLNC